MNNKEKAKKGQRFENKKNSKNKSTSHALCAVGIWSTLAPSAKLLMADLPSLETLCVGSLIAALFLLLLNVLNGKIGLLGGLPPRQLSRMAALGFLGLFAYSALYYYGIDQLSSQEACILNYLWPVMVMIFSVLILKEALTARKVIAMLLSFAGIVILTGGMSGGKGQMHWDGILSCMAAAVCYGLFSVLNKKDQCDQGLAMMISWAVTAFCALPAGLLTEHWVWPGCTQWLGLLWVGIMASAAAYLLWALGLAESDNTARTANLAYLTPFCSVLLSALLVGERIRPSALLALAFIIGGILIQNLPGMCRERDE